MSLWDDIKRAAGNVKDEVVDVFDGDEPKRPKPEPRAERPQAQGNAFRTVNAAYQKREDEFEKPLWLTGADQQSPYSSWDTKKGGYLDRLFTQQEKLQKEGRLNEQFSDPHATGIVTWDHVTKDNKDLRFGDIFDDGKYIGNLYEDKDGTEADADLMMGQLLLEPEELLQIGEDRDPQARMRSRIQEVRDQNNIDIPQAMAVVEQQEDVDKTQAKIAESFGGKGDDALAAGLGTAGGAVLAGGIAVSSTGIGLVPGLLITGVGAGLGGLAAWLNRDDISEQTASAFEITKQAYDDDQGNVIGDTASAAKQWAGVAGRGLTPLSNLARGVADTDRGNQIGALQEEDRPSWAKPVDIAATIADMGFTFGSTAGIAAYTGQMGVHTAGALTELTLGGGMRWDAQAGEFRNVYQDEQGDISIANAAGAWASTTIDAAQTVMVKGIYDKIKGADQKLVGTVRDGRTVAAVEQRAGRTFYLDADRKVIDSKVNFSQAFVPSEGVQLLAASGMARSVAAKGGRVGQTTGDDLYQASVSLARAESPIKAALVNAVGEGTEEAVQEALDTWSFDHKVDLQTLAEAYAYGAASGLGMGLAANYRTRDADAKELKGLVESSYIAMHGALPDGWDEQYKNMSIEQRRSYVKNTLDAEETAAFKEIFGDQIKLQGSSTASGQGLTNLQNQMIQEEIEKRLKKAAPPGDPVNRAAGRPIAPTAARRPDGSTKIVSGVVADDALTSGPRSLLHYYQQRLRNLPLVLKTIETQLNEARAEQARVAEGQDTSQADAKVAELEDMLELWTETEKYLPDMIKAVQAKVAVLTNQDLPIADRIAELDELNQQLDQFYRSSNDAVALAASMLRLRSPYDNVGSFHVGPAAVSLSSVKDGVEMNVETDWASLDVTTADFDGDRFTSSTGLALGRNSFRRARSGASWLSTERTPGEATSETLYKVAAVAPDESISTTANYIHNGKYLPAIQDLPGKWLRVFADAVVRRYSPQYTTALSDQLYTTLESRLLTKKPKDPIKELMKFFATDPAFAAALVEYGSKNNTNEPSVLTGMFRSYMDSLQVEINQHQASLIPPEDRKGAVKTSADSTRNNVPDQHRRIAPQQGATLLNTFFQYYGTSDMLRIGQVIRLSHVDYKDRGVAKADRNPLLDIAGREMRVLSQGHIQDAANAGLSEFDIPARVRAMALDITQGNEAAAFSLLTAKFGDTQFDGKDKIKGRRNVTVAQALTMAYVQQLRVDAAVAISRDPQLQMKLDLLEKAANDARGADEKKHRDGEMLILRDALGAFNLADLLGVGVTADWQTSGLLITGSLEQNVRLLAGQDRVDVAAVKRRLLGQTVPEAKQDLYSSVVDFIVEVANTEIARTSKRNESASKAALEVRHNVRDALKAAKLPQTREGVMALLDSADGLAIIAGLISETRIASFTDSTKGGTSLRDWVLEFFIEESDGKAEVLLWANRAYDSLHLAKARERMRARDKQTFSEQDEEYTEREARVDDTLAAFMEHLQKYNPESLRELQTMIGEASDRKSLEAEIEDLRQRVGFKAPIFMYENSMRQFDPSLASGGWGATGTSYGSAMRELLTPSKTFRDRTSKQMKFRAINVATAARLLDEPANSPQLLRLKREAEKRRLGAVKTMHPNDMADAALRMQYIATDAHNKGKEHEAVAAFGNPQVLEGVQTNFADPFVDSANQLFDVRDIADLRTRPELVFSTSRFVDDHGHPVEMPRLLDADGGVDIQAVLTAIANDGETGLADLLVEAILPRQYSFNLATGQTSVVAVGPRTLEELVTQRYAAAFKSNGPGNYTDKAYASFMAEISAAVQSVDFNYAAAADRAWQMIVMPRIMSSRGWSKKRVAAEYERGRVQLGKALMQAGMLYAQNPEDYANVVQDVVNNLVLDMNIAQNKRAQGRGRTSSYAVAARSQSRKEIEGLIEATLRMARADVQSDKVAVVQNIWDAFLEHQNGTKRMSAAEIADLRATVGRLGNVPTPVISLLESVLHDEPFAELHFVFGQGDVITSEQREAITGYLKAHPEIANQLNHDKDATEAMAWFIESTQSNLAEDAVQWSVLSRVVISHMVQSDAVEGWSTTDKLTVFKDDTYLDPTYSMLLNKLFAPESPLLAAAVEVTAGRPEVYTTAQLHESLTALFPTDGSVRWDQSIGAQLQAVDATYASSSSGSAAGLHGNSGKTIDALAMAAYTTTELPPASALRTVALKRTPQGFIGMDTDILEGAIGVVTVNGQPVRLEPTVGTPIADPYQVITSRRLELAAPMGSTIEIQFFDPLLRPVGAQWTNNIYFDGVVAYDSPQTNEFPSLVAALYNQANGILQLGTRFVLDAVKKGLPSVHRTHVDANGNWDLSEAPDPSIYLTTLARTLAVTTNLGYEALGREWMRPALKYVTMRHVVQYDDGSVSSVYDYIAQQRLDPDAMAARGPKLVALSERAANTFYGEVGNQGLRGFPLNGRLTAGSQAFSWASLTDRQKEVVRNLSTPVPLSQTSAARRQVLAGAGAILPTQWSDAVEDLVALTSLMASRDGLQAARAQRAKKLNIDFTEMRTNQRTIANELAREDDSTAFGLPDDLVDMLSKVGYETSDFSNDRSYHLIVTATGDLLKGHVTPANYKKLFDTLGSLTFGDTAVIDLAHLTNVDSKTLVKMVQQLTLAKVTISLRGVGANEHTRAVTEYLRSLHDYSTPIDQKDTFAPRESVNEYQLETAYESRLQQQGFSSATSRLLTLVPTGVIAPEFSDLAESQAYILDPNARIIANNVLLKQYPSVKATPLHPADVSKVTKMLLSMEAELLNAEVDGEIAGLSHVDAVQDLMARARNNALPLTTKGLELKKGMYEVYVLPTDLGGELKLYLHRAGSQFIRDERLDELRTSANRFVLGPTQTEADQTFVEGKVVDWASTGTSDILLTVEASQKWFGGKRIPLLGGDKGMYQTLPKKLDWVRGPIAGDLIPQEISNEADAIKKLNMMDMIGTFSQMAEVVGFDNMPIFFKGVTGEDFDGSQAHLTKMDMLRDILNTVRKDSAATPTSVRRAVADLAGGISGRQATLLALLDPQLMSEYATDLATADTAEAGAFFAAVAYLSIPGTSLADIEFAGGFTTPESRMEDRGSYYMPTAFTSYYDVSPAARSMVQEIFQQKLGRGVQLMPDYTIRKWFNFDSEGKATRFQDFRFGYAVRSLTGESVGESFDPTIKRTFSSHNARLGEQFGDALYAAAYSSDSFAEFIEDATSQDVITELRQAPDLSKNRPHYNMGPNQQTYRGNVARMLTGYFHTIDLTDQGEISEADQAELQKQIRSIAKTLFNDSTGRSDHHVHVLLRLALGRPIASSEAEAEASRIKLSTLQLGLKAMAGNIKLGYSPLRRGAVSLMPLEIRNAIIAANYGKEGRWAPRIYNEDRRISDEHAKTPDEFTRAFFDHALADSEANDIPVFKQIMDAVFHQYQQTSADLQSLPVSLDMMRDLDLLRRDVLSKDDFEAFFKNPSSFAKFAEENPDLVKSSLYYSTEQLLTPQIMHRVARSAAMAQQIGLADPKLLDLEAPTAELLEHVEKRYAAYARKKDIPFGTKASTRALRDTNATFTDNHSNSHRLFRNLLALHAAKALFNPALAIGAMIDTRMRLTLSDARKMVTGESLGPVGRRVASVVESQGRVGALARGFGWRAMYTEQQAAEVKRILNSTALTSAMNEVIYDQLASYSAELSEKGVLTPLVKLTKIANAMQDLGHGTKGKAMRRTYLEVAIADLVFRRGQSLDSVLAAISQDGAWIDRNFKESSQAGIQAMNDLRGTQDTMFSSAVNAAITPFTHSGNAGVNAVAQMTLAMPLMFQRYASNLFLTLTGARAIDQLAAHALNGRQKPGFWRAIEAKAKSENMEANPYIDVDNVIGGLDAMDAVINMGVTHSLLFTGGLIMGGLGLSGEDEEEKRRRRAAAAQGGVWLSDPRDIENDFRNAHALFLDEIPGLNKLFRNDAGVAVASPHWILKPLVSPLLGMERFFETGDIRQLKWGFEDAITSMPLFNMVTFNKAVTMSEELAHAAQDSAAAGNPGAPETAGFLTHLVAYYEHALFESSFLNALYVGFDDYDRDPYVMPLRDSKGELQRDAEGNTRANSDQHLSSEGLNGRGLALQPFVNDKGEVEQGYWRESGATTDSRILAESRLSYALISSLFTGLAGKGMNTRYDQAVKTRKVDKPKLNEKEQTAAFLRAYAGQVQGELNDGEDLSAEEAVALSYLNDKGNEVLTDDGAMAIFRGLLGGSVTPTDEALVGVYISYETRQKIQDTLLDELVISGMKSGLSESSAKNVAFKMLKGNGALPGISEILWDKNVIPYSETQEFQQLNTTYIQGPDGNVWATGFTRQKFLGAMGLAPLSRMHTSEDTNTNMDQRMNVAGFGINNTGQRSLRPVNDTLDTPTDAEIGDTITRAIEDLNNRSYGSGGGFGGFGGFGGGGGGSYAQRPVNTNYYPPRWTNFNFNPIVLKVPYANDAYSVRTDDVRTDLSLVRRERISSERGRLTQWQ